MEKIEHQINKKIKDTKTSESIIQELKKKHQIITQNKIVKK